MKVIFNNDMDNINIQNGMGIALGNFDGLHKGHITLIKKLMAICQDEGLKSMVYTFTNHPTSIINQEQIKNVITPNELKIKILSKYKIDYLYFQDFDEHFMQIDPQDFIKDILIDKFNVKSIIVGHDYKFGYKGKGNIETLKQLSNKYGFNIYTIAPVLEDGLVISSSRIRDLLIKGDVEQIFKYIEEGYRVTSKVVAGKNLGNKLGFPTINFVPEKNRIIPQNGVYITQTIIKDKTYKSITNIGHAPTAGIRQLCIETHILSFDADIYGKQVEVKFLKKIRNEKRFENLKELSDQIAKDIEIAESYFEEKGIYNKINVC